MCCTCAVAFSGGQAYSLNISQAMFVTVTHIVTVIQSGSSGVKGVKGVKRMFLSSAPDNMSVLGGRFDLWYMVGNSQ